MNFMQFFSTNWETEDIATIPGNYLSLVSHGHQINKITNYSIKIYVFPIYYVQPSHFKIFEIMHDLFGISEDKNMFLEVNIKDLSQCPFLSSYGYLVAGSKCVRMDHVSHLSSLREVNQVMLDFHVLTVVVSLEF